MLSKTAEVVQMLQVNRDRHREAWRKVRIDRLLKCWPGWTIDELHDAIRVGIDNGQLVLAEVLDKETNKTVDAVKLKVWFYKR